MFILYTYEYKIRMRKKFKKNKNNILRCFIQETMRS